MMAEIARRAAAEARRIDEDAKIGLSTFFSDKAPSRRPPTRQEQIAAHRDGLETCLIIAEQAIALLREKLGALAMMGHDAAGELDLARLREATGHAAHIWRVTAELVDLDNRCDPSHDPIITRFRTAARDRAELRRFAAGFRRPGGAP